MPSLGADMDAGKLLEWYIKPGDTVKRGDIVALVDTDKAAIEVEIFEDGVVGELLVEPGTKVPVGTPLATVLPVGARVEAPVAAPAEIAALEVSAAAPAAPAAAATRPEAPAVRGPVALAERPAEAPAAMVPPPPHATPAARNHARALGVDLERVTGTGRHGVITSRDVEAAALTGPPEEERVRASPLARKVAERLGVDLSTVHGTGPDGAIGWQDVEAAAGPLPTAPEPRPAPAPGQAPAPAAPGAGRAKAGDERYAAMRRAIAAAMAKSKREIPHYYLSHHVDLSAALAWLEETNLQRSVTERLLPAALLLRAAARAAREVPEVNGFYRDGGFEPSERVHLGVGISLRQGGLIAPAIHDADSKDLATLMADLRDLVKRARSLQLRSSEMTDATLTTTLLGDQGVESVFGVIYPPQVALVGFGRVLERPWAENGMVGVRPQLHLTLAADHRASDGHRGGLYLSAIDRLLQHPEEL